MNWLIRFGPILAIPLAFQFFSNNLATSSDAVTLSIISITIVISILAFWKDFVWEGLVFQGPAVAEANQWYRLVTYGFVHLEFWHLAFNMFSLYSFGQSVAEYLSVHLGAFGSAAYLFIYLASIVIAIIPSLLKHKYDHEFVSLGASGGVAAVIAFAVISDPSMEVFVLFISLPGWIYLLGFIALSIYWARDPEATINHSAHLAGAIAGLLFGVLIAAYSGTNAFQNLTRGIQNNSKFENLMHVGDCTNDAVDGPIDARNLAISCSRPHQWEVYFQYTLEDEFSGDWSSFAQDKCLNAFDDFVGISYEDSKLDFTWVRPFDGATIKDSDMTITCFVGKDGVERRTGTLRDSRL